MQRRYWQQWEREAVQQLYPHVPTAEIAAALKRPVQDLYRLAQHLGLKKTPAFLAGPLSARTKLGRHPNSAAHRFKKGATPANKGLRRPGWAKGRMASTQFKKGCMAGAAQHNWVPIGTLRIKDGVLSRKTTDDPALYPARRWQPVHTLLWIEANGPVPVGHIVVFKAGLKTHQLEDITLDRIECISWAENMRRNTYHSRYPKEVGLLIQARGALNRMINKRGRSSMAETQGGSTLRDAGSIPVGSSTSQPHKARP